MIAENVLLKIKDILELKVMRFEHELETQPLSLSTLAVKDAYKQILKTIQLLETGKYHE